MTDDALTRITRHALQHHRPIRITWTQDLDTGEIGFPRAWVVIGADAPSGNEGRAWQLFFTEGTRGWRYKCAIHGQREQRGLKRLLDAIEANSWPDVRTP